MLDDSETIRQAVENAFRPTEILLESTGHTRDSTFPNLSTEELVEGASSPEPEIPPSNRITLGGPGRRGRNHRHWKAAFYDEFGDAERVEVIDPTTGERVDVGSLIERFPGKLDTETIPVAEFQDAEILERFLSDLLWTLSIKEKPAEFRRID